MKGSDFVAEFLKKKDISLVFEMSGGMIAHLLDSINRLGYSKIISMHHEQSAAFAVDAVGRCNGQPAVAMATSGPGAINLLTGIGSCFFDSSPGLFITGQVNRYEQKGNKNVRQLGFQETDIVSMAKPIVKKAWKVESAEELPGILEEAYQLTMIGRPGPVLIDIPMDIQREEFAFQEFQAKTPSVPPISQALLDELFQSLQEASRPLILAGRGIRAAGAHQDFLDLIKQVNIPVVSSLLGRDVLAEEHPLYAGFIGSYGNRWANKALYEADFLIVLGSRLDVRQTGADTKSFSHNKKIYHVDCEKEEINNRVKGCVPIQTDLKSFFHEVNSQLASQKNALPLKPHFLTKIQELKKKYPDTEELKVQGINPNLALKKLSLKAPDKAFYVADVGQHQMWAAQSLRLKKEDQFITSGGMGAMGFALPAAIGTALTTNQTVVCIAGDGGFQTNIQELQTIKRNNLPIKIIILNNQCHGMVRQFQESYFESNYQSTLNGYSAPDFTKIAKAYDIDARTIVDEKELDENISWFWQTENSILLQVMIDTYTNTYPKIAFGRPISEMEPEAKPISFEST